MADGSSSAMQESAPPGSPRSTATTTTPSTLVSARVWTVLSPPPLNSVSGALIPKALSHKRLRKISIEVHRLQQSSRNKRQNDNSSGYYEECLVRVLEPANKQVKKAAKAEYKELHKHHHFGAGAAYSTATSLVSGGMNQASLADDTSVAGVPAEFRGGGDNDDHFTHEALEGWKAKYRYPIKCMSIKGTHKTGVFIRVELGHAAKHTRELIFDTTMQAEEFVNVVNQELKLEKERGETKLRLAFSGRDMPTEATEDITFLLEVVSGWNLPAGDLYWSDPYVVIHHGKKEIHRTKYISKTLDPIWTLKTDSLCLFTVSTRELFLGNGLSFTVKDYDQVGNHETLGVFEVEPQTIFDGSGDRLVYKLHPPPKSKEDEVPGHVAIRCRRASPSDIQFLEEYRASKKKFGGSKIRATEKEVIKGGASNLVSYFRRQKRVIKNGTEEIKEYKVRPGPDPKREEETTWLTYEQLKAENIQESHQWIDTGSGELGRLFVEILGCEGLPNLDTGGRNKTDAFVALVFEDSIGKTDIIDDCLSPMWPPWTQRAFIFHMFHGSSQVFLGVFDYDDGVNPTDDHDLIGRVSVDLTNLRHDTTYVLKYNIYATARMSDRKSKGTITIRLRVEINDQRKLLLSNLEPPPEMYVNVKTRKDYKVVHYTCTGKYDMSRYDMKYINAYVEELLALQHGVYYVQDAVLALILWRGTMPIPFLGKNFRFPIHSLSAFLSLTLLVERPQLFPAMLFASLGWFMIAVMDYRRALPNPWIQCKTFSEFVWTLIYGKSYCPPDDIKPFQNEKESAQYMEDWQNRIKEAEDAAARAYEENLKAQEEYEREMDEIAETTLTDISTKTRGISIDPFKPILYPVQQNLAMVCRYMRHAEHIVSWEESYLAFWVTVGCFLLAFICTFVPWFFIIRWSARIVVWVVFGPWMKLVDIYVVKAQKPLTPEQQAKKREAERIKRKETTSALLAEARIKRENAAKLKAMKKYMFGKFITKVPVLKEDRYRDTPLPDSRAMPYKPELLPLSEVAMQEAGYNRKRVPGQHLVGDMIPRIEDIGFTEAPTGQATAHPRLVDKSGPGGAVGSGPESDVQAYAKIGSVVVGAAVVSWCVVPVFSAITEQVLNWF